MRYLKLVIAFLALIGVAGALSAQPAAFGDAAGVAAVTVPPGAAGPAGAGRSTDVASSAGASAAFGPGTAAVAQAPAAVLAASCGADFLFPTAETALSTSDRAGRGKISPWRSSARHRGRHSRFPTYCGCAGGCTKSGDCVCTSCDGSCDIWLCIICCSQGCSENCSPMLAGAKPSS